MVAALEEVCTACHSRVGFYHDVDRNQRGLRLQAWSTPRIPSGRRGHDDDRLLDLDQAGHWANALRARAPVIINHGLGPADHRGLPKVRTPLLRLMVAPVFRGELVAALIGVGDGERDYGDADARFLASLAALVFDILRQHRLEHLSEFDAVTGLPNREHFLRSLSEAVDQADAAGNALSLAYVDLDHFGAINEKLGQAGGDQVLGLLAERWRADLRPPLQLARVGADEFALIMPHDGADSRVLDAVTKLRTQASLVIAIGGHSIRATVSVGLARFPADATDAAGLLVAAEKALRTQRGSGHSGVALFDPESSRQATRWFETESALRMALERSEFRLLYQPQVELRTGLLLAAEALIRWQHDDQLLSPAAFLDVVEGTDLFAPVGRWVLDQACRQARLWLDRDHPVRVAVNVFAAQVSSGELVDDVRDALRRHALPPRLLELEVVETSVLREPASAARTLRALTRMGVGLALDDFGTGWSSMVYLKHFPFSVVKIDQVFTRNVSRDPTDVSIVRSTIELAHRLGMRVLAEGVENVSHMQHLAQFGCDEGQGYLFSRPVPAHQIEVIAMERRDLRPATVLSKLGRGAVLVVHADTEQQLLIAMILGGYGYLVLQAASVAEALAHLTRERVDVLIVDLSPRGQDPFGFLERVRRLYPYIRRIALCSNEDAEAVIQAVNRGGVSAFLPHPWDAAELLQGVRNAMREPLRGSLS